VEYRLGDAKAAEIRAALAAIRAACEGAGLRRVAFRVDVTEE
jgi:hypothetical protein